MRTIFELFGKSPFEPLAKHGQMVDDVIQEITPLIEALLAQDWSEAKEVADRISRMEHRADELKAEIRDHLPRSIFLPVDRGDLLRLLKAQDAMADAVEDLAVLVTMRETPVPDTLKPHVRALMDQVLQAAKTMRIGQKLGDVPNHAETAGDMVRLMLAKG
jgi:predicted phosphate transport protein (TIGR00153 family)